MSPLRIVDMQTFPASTGGKYVSEETVLKPTCENNQSLYSELLLSTNVLLEACYKMDKSPQTAVNLISASSGVFSKQ
jgi:hypothetical protein